MTQRSSLWLGDFVRAIHGLDVHDDATAGTIARALGVPWPSATDKHGMEDAVEVRVDERQLSLSPRVFDVGSSTREPERRDAARPIATAELEPLSDEPMPAPSWLSEHRQDLSFDKPTEFAEGDDEPLFEPAWTRNILRAVLSTDADTGPVDIEALIEDVAWARPVERLPHLPARSTRRGVQLLVDYGEGMTPFARDQAMLRERLRWVLGDEHIEALRFADFPELAGPGPRSTWRAYIPPSPGTPVLVVSDLGLSGARGSIPVSEWIKFAQKLASNGCPLIGLVPFPPSRWPAELSEAMRLVTWDRSTTVAMAQRMARGARGRRVGTEVPNSVGKKNKTEDWSTRIDALAQERPHEVALAEVLSLVPRIEPHLLRRARLELLPSADVSVEADLWFGRLVRVRGTSAILIAEEALEVLRGRLVLNHDRLRAAHDFTAKWCMTANWTARVEEELAFHGLRMSAGIHDSADEDIVRGHFRRMLSGLASHEHGNNVAVWTVRALRRMPSALRKREDIWAVALAASARLHGQRVLTGNPPPGAIHQIWPGLLPKDVEEVPVAVKRLGGELLLRVMNEAPEGIALLWIPRTNPLVVEVQSNAGRVLAFIDAEGGKAAADVGAGDVVLRTLRGHRYRLAGGEGEPNADLERESSYALLRRACAAITVEKQDGDVLGTAYLIDRELAATAAHVVRGAIRLCLQFATEEVEASLLHVDFENDCAILRLRKPMVDIEPLKMASNYFIFVEWMACSCSLGGNLTITGDQGMLGAEAGSMLEAEADSKRMRLHLGAREHPVMEMTNFSGAPVMVDGFVIGHIIEQSIVEHPDRASFIGCPTEYVRALLGPFPAASQKLQKSCLSFRHDGVPGTAYLIRDDLAVTCAKFFRAAGERVVLSLIPKIERHAEVIMLDHDNDCALLRLDLPIYQETRCEITAWSRQGDTWTASWPGQTGLMSLQGIVSGGVKPGAIVRMQLECKIFLSTEADGLAGAPILVGDQIIGHMTGYIGPAPGNPGYRHLHACPGAAVFALLRRAGVLEPAPDTDSESSESPPESVADPYIERPADAEVFERLRNAGACYVFAPRQSGKSKLIRHAARKLRGLGHRVVNVDLSFIGDASVRESEWFYRLTSYVAKDLGMPAPSEQLSSSSDLSPARVFLDYIAFILSEPMGVPLVLILDEIDCVADLPFKSEFFSAINELAARHWTALSLCVMGSTWPEELLTTALDSRERTIAQQTIIIGDFSLEAAREPLGEALRWLTLDTSPMVERIFEWVGGHPFLVHLLCAELRRQGILLNVLPADLVDRVVKNLLQHQDSVSTFGYIQSQLDSDPRRIMLVRLYADVLSGSHIRARREDALHRRLIEIGLVGVAQTGQLQPRNRLLMTRFDKEWVARML